MKNKKLKKKTFIVICFSKWSIVFFQFRIPHCHIFLLHEKFRKNYSKNSLLL